jgi:hypothetical protein
LFAGARYAGAALPLLRFPVRDSIAKRLRSFGDLQSACVPDVDNARRAWRASARAGAQKRPRVGPTTAERAAPTRAER